jgi:hypothetical protein
MAFMVDQELSEVPPDLIELSFSLEKLEDFVSVGTVYIHFVHKREGGVVFLAHELENLVIGTFLL